MRVLRRAADLCVHLMLLFDSLEVVSSVVFLFVRGYEEYYSVYTIYYGTTMVL